MKIILEGCDGSGKSTLAKRLANKIGANIEHHSKPLGIESCIEKLCSPGDTIYDRFMLGQFVYNTPEERKMTREDLNNLISYCKSRKDIVLFYLDTPIDIILERMQRRDEREIESDKKMMKRLGVNNIEEYINLTKERYNLVNDGFIRITDPSSIKVYAYKESEKRWVIK